MKRFLTFILGIICVFGIAQDNKETIVVEYNLEYISDSTSTNKRNENFKLIIQDGKSYFASSNFIKRDSIVAEMQKNVMAGFLSMGASNNTSFKYVLIKNNEQQSFYDKFLKNYLSYDENVKFDWKLHNETIKLGELTCQKATTQYGGRDWVAWFTPDIPINNGPYKFYGLPGLIVKVEDTKGHYSFDMITLKTREPIKNNIFEEKYLKLHTKTTKEKYRKSIENFKENIIHELARNNFYAHPDSVKGIQELNKKQNNPIELK
ncbi:MAG: GLPGLI family protein [Bergeyella zoohelcum]|nr:GLPGLI family protein [Bergeyella zoohelcum]